MSGVWDNISTPSPLLDIEHHMTLTQIQGQSVSDSVKDTFVYITHLGLCTGISVIGVVINIFNMAVFWKQGFKEYITVSLFALSVCDLCVLVLFLWASVCLSPGFAGHSDTSAFLHELHLVVGGSQRMTLLRLSVWITAFIAVERCVGTLRPHRVRQFFTPASSGVAIAVMAVLVSLSAIPVYTTVRIGTGFSRLTNSSRLMVTRVVSDRRVVSISTGIAGSLQLLCLIVILVSNMVLVLSFRRRSRQWQTRSFNAARSVVQASIPPQRNHQDASSDPHRSDSSLPRSATIETASVPGSATIETASVPGSATIETASVPGSATIETASVQGSVHYRDSLCPSPRFGHYRDSLCPRFGHYRDSLCPTLGLYRDTLCPRFGHYRDSLCPRLGHYRDTTCPRFGHYRDSLCPTLGHYRDSLCPTLGHYRDSLCPRFGHYRDTLCHTADFS